MPFEQLSLLDFDTEAAPRRPARQTRPWPATPVALPAQPKALPPGDVRVEHCYPEAWAVLSEHGAEAIAVLHALATGATVDDGRLVVAASTRASPNGWGSYPRTPSTAGSDSSVERD